MTRTFPQSSLDLACGNITLKANSRLISKPKTYGNVNKQVVCLTLLPNTYHACSYQNVMFSQKYQNFQNTSLLGFKFDSHCLILSFALKYQNFQNTSLLGFKFSSDHLILSLLPQKYQKDRKSTRLNSSHERRSRMPSSA